MKEAAFLSWPDAEVWRSSDAAFSLRPTVVLRLSRAVGNL